MSIFGSAGNDVLEGGPGDDSVEGRAGDDLLLGRRGADTLDGGIGDDTLKGGRGADLLRGRTGSDVLLGDRGADTLRGGSGNDFLSGGSGQDKLFGGGGDDFLDGGAGSNTYVGNGGADTFVIGDGSFNTITGFNLAQGDQLALEGDFSVDALEFIADAGGVTIEVAATGEAIAFLSDFSVADLTDNLDTVFTTVAAEAIAVSFADISLPSTIEFGAAGSVTLELTNTLGLEFSGVVPLELFISTDDDRDSESDERNDGLLYSIDEDLTLAAGESTTITLNYENLSSVVAPGAYHLLAGVEGGELTSELVSAPGSDSVLTWHATALNAIQEFGEVDNDTIGIGIEPTVGSRALAIVQTSVFNTVNAFDEDFEFYLDLDPGTPAVGTSADAAVAGAAVTALVNVLPGTQDLSGSLVAQLENSLSLSTSQVESLLTAAGLDSILGASTPGAIGPYANPFLSDVPTVPANPTADVSDEVLEGFLLGVNAASQVIDARAYDGFTGFFDGIDDPATYVPPGEFEDYVWIGELAIDSATGESAFGDTPFALSPGWGSLQSFSGQPIGDFIDTADLDENGDGVLLDGRPFANAADPVVRRRQRNLYIEEINEVQVLGALEDTDITTVTRTQDETEVAIFWAYDRADTFRPYGQLHQIAQEAAFRAEGELIDSARTLALTSIALGDAAIAAWFGKYDEVQSRPQDVFSGDGQGTPIAEIDRSRRTEADPFWQPLLPDPAFPDYLSGHSAFAGAFGGTLDVLFPEATDIPVVSQELVPGNGIFTTSDDSLFDIDDFNAVRTFGSYGAIGNEDAISRVFGGIHVREATEDAVIVGNVIGDFVASTLLAPVA